MRSGSQGPQGPVGPGVTKQTQVIHIPGNSKYVEFPVFLGWETAIYSIRYDGQLGSTNISINNFDPTKGIVGPGTTVGVFNGTTTTTGVPVNLRHYFVFTGGTPAITATPDEKFILQVTKLQ